MPSKLVIAIGTTLAVATVLVARSNAIQSSEGVFAAKAAGIDGAAAQARALEAQAQAPYRGLVVKPNPMAQDEQLRLQEEIGAALSRLDFIPAERLSHID